MRLWIVLAVLPCVAFGQQFQTLKNDLVLSRSEVEALTVGKILTFYEGGTARYAVGGAYSYSYAGGATAFGKFEIRPEGAVCIDYRNGRVRCDLFVHSHGRIVMLTESGKRFPVRLD